MKVLVCAASRHGATVEVAATIGAVLHGAGHDAYVLAPSEVQRMDGYDAAVIGSGIYRDRWLGATRDIVTRHRDALAAMPVWLFSSGPVGEPPKPVEDPPDAARLSDLVGARGHRTFPGLVERRRLGLGERALMAVVRAPEGDFRPWGEIETWAHEIADALAAEPSRDPAAQLSRDPAAEPSRDPAAETAGA